MTNDDVNIAQKIFVKEVAGLKGQTTHRDPILFKEEIIEIPPEITQQYDNLALYMDIMFVNRMPMLTSIDDKIRNRSHTYNRMVDERGDAFLLAIRISPQMV